MWYDLATYILVLDTESAVSASGILLYRLMPSLSVYPMLTITLGNDTPTWYRLKKNEFFIRAAQTYEWIA